MQVRRLGREGGRTVRVDARQTCLSAQALRACREGSGLLRATQLREPIGIHIAMTVNMSASRTCSDASAGQGATPADEHLALEGLLARLLDALSSRETGDFTTEWRAAEQGVLDHLLREEQTVLACLFESRPREARALFEDHAYLRRRVAQLRATLPRLSIDAVRAFADELRAHGRHEDAVLYGARESH